MKAKMKFDPSRKYDRELLPRQGLTKRYINPRPSGKGLGPIYKVNYPRAIGRGVAAAGRDILYGGGTVGQMIRQKVSGGVRKAVMGSKIGGVGRTMGRRLRSSLPSYKKGGVVRKTGIALLHKGERVVPKKKRKY